MKHGLAGTPIYRVWRNMKSRCLNPNNCKYPSYGARGIKICDEWLNDFQNFYSDVSTLENFGNLDYTLDRIDVNGNYELSNVRWIHKSLQSRNTTRNIYVDYYGTQMILSDVAKILDIDYSALYYRYSKGWRGDKLFSPVKKVVPKSDLVLVQDDNVLTTSLIVAEKFGKNHFDVLRAIENCLKTLRNIATRTNDSNFAGVKIDSAFIKNEYTDAKGERRPMYYLSRDAFSLIVMGFTGEKAMEWKWRYIQEFNRMEAALKGKSKSPKINPPQPSDVQLCLPF